jgi:hypothetical protein
MLASRNRQKEGRARFAHDDIPGILLRDQPRILDDQPVQVSCLPVSGTQRKACAQPRLVPAPAQNFISVSSARPKLDNVLHTRISEIEASQPLTGLRFNQAFLWKEERSFHETRQLGAMACLV